MYYLKKVLLKLYSLCFKITANVNLKKPLVLYYLLYHIDKILTQNTQINTNVVGLWAGTLGGYSLGKVTSKWPVTWDLFAVQLSGLTSSNRTICNTLPLIVTRAYQGCISRSENMLVTFNCAGKYLQKKSKQLWKIAENIL